MEIGVTSFADLAIDPASGEAADPGRRLRELVAEIELADAVGLDVFGVGEHHRRDYAVSSPAVALAGAATRTRRIRLSSAVTVLSTDDPVRVFEQFSTLDQLSGGRAEIIAGRGSFTESYPLFGASLDDYDELFAEKLELLLTLRSSERVTWAGSGRHRAPLDDAGVYPRPAQEALPVWIGVGGTPASVVRAGLLGLSLVIAVIGGEPARFTQFSDLYREALRRGEHDAGHAQLAINSHAHVADDAQQAADEMFEPYAAAMNRVGRERGWPPMVRQQFEAARTPRGALFCGDPEQVAEKILAQHELFHHTRFLAHMGMGGLAHDKVLRAIELLGTEVAPRVRAEVARRGALDAAAAEVAGA
ncbi:MAG TPA: LLM class flavin-dependent oxidoreductase [Conexibacter sp.]|nr:LLM class flavin-dependent oxidoreductase [Conexibacter sp.]